MQPQDTDLVYIIVTERPNKVWVCVNSQIHTAKWRTSDTIPCLFNADGNIGILNAAMIAWMGKSHFTMTYGELDKASQGWGAWRDYPNSTPTII